MRVRVFPKTLRVEIGNETRVFPESLIFETKMRVSQKSANVQWKSLLSVQTPVVWIL